MRLLDQVRARIRQQNKAASTEKIYCGWIKRFVRYNYYTLKDQRHPKEMGEAEMKRYLTYLATKPRPVSASTQRQALNAIIYLYRDVLKKDIEEIDHLRARKNKYLPVVLPGQQVMAMLNQIKHPAIRLACDLMYGAGLRRYECLALEIRRVDIQRRQIHIFQSKGHKDRIVPIPMTAIPKIQKQIEIVENYYKNDLARGFVSHPLGECHLFCDSRMGNGKRMHIYPQRVLRTLKESARKVGIRKRVKCHMLRHCFATHLLDSGHSIRKVQKLLGHTDVKTTMIYLHVSVDFLEGVKSPLDVGECYVASG